jgi:hypothetical protein
MGADVRALQPYEAEELAVLQMQLRIVGLSERGTTSRRRTMFGREVLDTPKNKGPSYIEKVL